MNIREPIVLDGARRCGNTTRIIDSLIQKFFIEGECTCYDHYFSKDNPVPSLKMKEYVKRTILRRLSIAHGLDFDDDLIINRNNFTIKLKHFK